ncbi:hypothetical protein ENBRE01_0492 [Enteropsectra breve]|nr:hypothetical protein ENBRE01_0492 [Enteropsectra breve]
MFINLIKSSIEKFASPEKAADWDNTGILVNSYSEGDGRKIMLTIDLTDDVVNECIEKQINYIVAYHPVIFSALKSITDKKLIKCIQNKISVYSPHTQLDPLMNAYVYDRIDGGSVSDVASQVKNIYGMECIRVAASDMDKQYSKEEIKVGMGAAFRGPSMKDSLLIVGEMTHHDLLACKKNGTSVIMLEHSNSERIFLPELKRLMEENGLADFEIFISTTDRDPVSFI